MGPRFSRPTRGILAEAARGGVVAYLFSAVPGTENYMVRRLPAVAWSALAAMVLLAGWMVSRPVALPRQTQVDPDHELLMAVERAVHNDGPAALDPAALLADEMVQNMTAINSPARKKEPTHEN